jgi:hypothetical protein
MEGHFRVAAVVALVTEVVMVIVEEVAVVAQVVENNQSFSLRLSGNADVRCRHQIMTHPQNGYLQLNGKECMYRI